MKNSQRKGEKNKNQNLADVITVEELATLLRVNKKTVYDAASRGQIPCVRIGRMYRFSRKAVLTWLDGSSATSSARGV